MTYNVTPANSITKTQAHVKELNANILILSFSGATGAQKADLYISSNSCAVLVAHGSCAPVNDTFIRTVTIQL